jgi:2-polyprenyl-6-methoxyphenol hydroxylase-like FAD-dependent oxidoreductase
VPGLLLAGDAAGLAFPESGEGIRPAIESGLLAARAIIESRGVVTQHDVAAYEQRLRERFSLDSRSWFDGPVSDRIASGLAPWLLAVPAFVRRVVLDRWFLRRHQPALAL